MCAFVGLCVSSYRVCCVFGVCVASSAVVLCLSVGRPLRPRLMCVLCVVFRGRSVEILSNMIEIDINLNHVSCMSMISQKNYQYNLSNRARADRFPFLAPRSHDTPQGPPQAAGPQPVAGLRPARQRRRHGSPTLARGRPGYPQIFAQISMKYIQKISNPHTQISQEISTI